MIFFLNSKQVPAEHQLSVNVVLKMIEGEDAAILVDVREFVENQAVRIPGSVLIPIKNIKSSAGKLDQKQPIILYCKEGVRSDKAYHILKRIGFERIYVLQGGLNTWIDHQAPLETPSIPQWVEGSGCES